MTGSSSTTPIPEFNYAPKISDLHPDHPFRNPKTLAKMQKLFPNYKPMTDKEYLAKPWLHPINAMGFGLREIMPHYGWDVKDFPGGWESMWKVEWPSHAYVRCGVECRGRLAIIQIEKMDMKKDGSVGSVTLGDCFECELENKGIKVFTCGHVKTA